ncbi:Pre-rRNA-processing protein ESF2 [Trichodelitschia bisporula]|uniref:18S rRNA factor 2 n=1 Tax=Trichodelitschia bisporula TaxID=703511 RepID=A0A6G1IAD6_9PEZI|nr:Pre-rRNA-processing protein ESF2 [Trichodelitschia bisporula]
MATQKRNEWLEADASDEDDDRGYDSDLQEDSRGATLGGRSTKRRKLEDGSTSEASEVDEQSGDEADDDVNVEEESISNAVIRRSPSPKRDASPDTEKPKKLAKRLAKAADKASRTGVVYISRIPPFMKPHTLKHFLAPHAPSGLGRLFLTPETAEAHKSRVKSGGNKKQNYTDGWVEFLSKKEAKIAVETLNACVIGGKKGGYYHDDVWNLKYLTGFKWRHLTEQIANENAERSAKLRAELSREKREQREYLRNVERAKMLEGMERKQKQRKLDQALPAEGADQSTLQKTRRQFRQVEVIRGKTGFKDEPDGAAGVERVLGKIF